MRHFPDMTGRAETKGVIYEFGKFVLDPDERVFFADGAAIHLTGKVFDTLLLLVEHNGRLLTKDEMMSSLWNDSFVEESNLAKNISRLRKILNIGGTALIETLPKRGYRFRADVKEFDGESRLLVHRRLRVRVTQTLEDDAHLRKTGVHDSVQTAMPARRKIAVFITACVAAVAAIVASGAYFWASDVPAAISKDRAVRITSHPNDELAPSWTTDGRIRFLRRGPDKQTRSFVIAPFDADKTEKQDPRDFYYDRWSPDEKKVLFQKRGNRSALYLADADGSNEIQLPFSSGNLDWSPDSQRIVYQEKISAEDSEIFVYSPGTRESTNVTNNPAFDADPSFSPDGKQIVFASLRDGNAEIYLMRSDGGDVRRLTNHPAWDCHPVFSPDGTAISFSSDRDNENSDVYEMNVDGGDIRRLTDWRSNESVGPGCWSRDGTMIAFTSDRNGNDDIYVVGAEASLPRLMLADDNSDLRSPAISPDGSSIAFHAANADRNGELRVYDTRTEQTRVLLKTDDEDSAPAFSPDGEWIAFQYRVDSNTEVCIIRKDGANFANLSRNATRDVKPAWSPDGRQISFSSNRDGNYGIYNLYLMNSDGSDQHLIYTSRAMSLDSAWSADGKQILFTNDKEDGATGNFEIFATALDTAGAETRLTFRPRADSYPQVSPDGKRVVFVSAADGNAEIYMMNIDGTNQIRITRDAGNDISPRWFPDGKRLIFSSDRGGKFAIYEIAVAE